MAEIASDRSGNLYVAGSLQSGVTFYGPSGDNSISFSGGNGYTYYWVKLGADGQFITARTVTPARETLNNDLVDPVLAVDQAQNVYVAGGTQTGGFSLDFPVIAGDNISQGGNFIARYNENGDPVWFKGFGGNHSIANIASISSIKTDRNSNLYLFGAGWDQTSDLLWKLDGQGTGLWNKTITTTLKTGFKTLFVNDNDQVLISGDYIVNPAMAIGETDNHAIFFDKYATDGATLYAKTLQGYSIVSYLGLYDVAIDKNGNIDMVGYFNGSVKLLGASGDPQHPRNDFNNSMFIAHFPELQ